MNKKLLLILMMSLALAACQNDKAQAAKAPTEPAAVAASTSITVAETKKVSLQTEQKQIHAASGNAVAVTKPAKSNAGQSMQAALHQAGAEIKANAEAMIAKQAVAKEAVMPTAPVAMLGDAAKGKSLARKCKACHNFTAKKKVGPGLQGVFGRKAGIMPDMRYSPVLAAGGWVWNEKNLALWVCNSKKAVISLSGNAAAKTRMAVQHFCDATKQADLIAFLKTL